MKPWTIALAALVVLAIAWFVWPANSASAPPDRAHSPAVPVSATRAPEPSSSPAIESSPIARTSAAQQPASSNPPAPAQPDAAEILVRGTVRDEQGQPVPSIGIRWVDDRGIEIPTSVENGAYAAAGMHAGRYLVTLSNAGWRQEQLEVTLEAQPAVQERDFTAHANPLILIRIVSTDGAPLIGFDEEKQALPGNELLAYVSRRPPPDVLDPDLLVRQATSDCARFTNHWGLKRSGAAAGADCLGQIELFEPPPLYVSLVSGNARVATREIAAPVPVEIAFTLEADEVRAKKSGLRVRLLQADGKSPVAKGYAMLSANNIRNVEGDAQGRIEVRDLRSGRYALTLRGTGSGGRNLDVVLPPGEILDLGDVVLGSGPKLSIHFDFPGDAGPQVLFVVKPEHAGDPLGTLGAYDNSNFGTGAKNPYSLSVFAAGTYEFRVTGLGDPQERDKLKLGARPQRVVLAGEATSEIVVKIEPLTEICLRPPRDSIAWSRWLISTDDGLPCQRVRIEGRAPARISLVPGAYTIARIDAETNALGTPQSFTVGSSFLALDLVP